MDMPIPIAAMVFVQICIAGLLWRGSSAARGWCRECNAPDLWTSYAFTRNARVYGVLAYSCAVLGTAIAIAAPRIGSSPQCYLTASATAALLELIFAIKSRIHRHRQLSCRTCGTQYDPIIKRGTVNS